MTEQYATPHPQWRRPRLSRGRRPGPCCGTRDDQECDAAQKRIGHSAKPDPQPTEDTVAPVLSSVVPNSGPAAGNTIVTLNGSGFVGVTAVSFGATPATTFTFNSGTKITATAPPGTGTVQVSVKLPGGVTSNSLPYTYVAAPTLTSVSPSQGPAAGGTTVTLTGTALTGATAVSFGATPATSFTVNSANRSPPWPRRAPARCRSPSPPPAAPAARCTSST